MSEMRTFRCPLCGRISSVAEGIARPICVHAWDGGTPEIWDGDDTDGEGRTIEESPNKDYRTPGPNTWAEMELFVMVVKTEPADD